MKMLIKIFAGFFLCDFAVIAKIETAPAPDSRVPYSNFASISGDVIAYSSDFSFDNNFANNSQSNWEMREKARLKNGAEASPEIQLVTEGENGTTGSAWNLWSMSATTDWRAEIRFTYSQNGFDQYAFGDGLGVFIVDESSIATESEEDPLNKLRGVHGLMRGLGIILSSFAGKVCTLFSASAVTSNEHGNCTAQCSYIGDYYSDWPYESSWDMIVVEVHKKAINVTLIRESTGAVYSCLSDKELEGLDRFLADPTNKIRFGVGARNGDVTMTVRIRSVNFFMWQPMKATTSKVSSTTKISTLPVLQRQNSNSTPKTNVFNSTGKARSKSNNATKSSFNETTTLESISKLSEAITDPMGPVSDIGEMTIRDSSTTKQTISTTDNRSPDLTAKTNATTRKVSHYVKPTALPVVAPAPTKGPTYSYTITAKMRVVQVRLPVQRARREVKVYSSTISSSSFSYYNLNPNDWSSEMNNTSTEMYQTVKAIFIQQAVLLYRATGFSVTEQDVNVTTILPALCTVATSLSASVRIGGLQQTEALRSAILLTMNELKRQGVFNDVFGPGGFESMDIQQVIQTSSPSGGGLSDDGRIGIACAILGLSTLAATGAAVFFLMAMKLVNAAPKPPTNPPICERQNSSPYSIRQDDVYFD